MKDYALIIWWGCAPDQVGLRASTVEVRNRFEALAVYEQISQGEQIGCLASVDFGLFGYSVFLRKGTHTVHVVDA